MGNTNENDNKNNGAKLALDLKDKRILVENTKDNTNDNNRSLTPIYKDNDNSFISSMEENNMVQNKSYLMPNSGKQDKILEMIRKERIKKKKLEEELKKIDN